MGALKDDVAVQLVETGPQLPEYACHGAFAGEFSAILPNGRNHNILWIK
jgi:hypothetical protein